ncbi:uncharacterized protein LOC124456447 [Xenia sp. Carnegie-2017]|uniref:uncharacterized protein LOC124456447 n=1 Tax=Xenia sp. Carnegie-2017 TaxID=2897299 RepID=UPI001F04A588|nr:uncharacterized protein LOC124456447 [Xenia sp. Carnegie-2017]
MKFAIFDFGDNTFDIGQTSWIQDENSTTFDNESWLFTHEIIVKWPIDFNAAKRKMRKKIDEDTTKTESERYPARILKFGGKGQRISQKNYKYHSDSDKEDYEVQFGSHISKKPPSKKRKVQKDSATKNSLYSMVKEKYKQTEFETVQNEEDNLNENRSDSTSFLQLKKIENRLKELSEECRNLKIQTTNLAALMNSVKELPIIVKSLETLINELQSSSIHSVSPPVNTDLPKHLSPLCLKSSCDAPTIEENDNAGNGVEEMVALAPGIKILPSQRDLLTLQGNPKNYTYALMDMIWSRDVLATHS